ncbi:MAG: DUF47 family protein [Promethearchaeota archaeon]|nr:MAG: DUF47 family protein [Candidatus Lokiarchaeota archaeon]
MSDAQITRQEMKALDILQDHLRQVLASITELRNLVDDWFEKKEESVQIHIKKLEDIENKANDIKWKILNELSSAQTMLNREDFMRLVMTNDSLVDHTEGIGHRVLLLMNWIPDTKTVSYIKDMLDAILKMMMTLRESIFVLTQNSENSINKASEIYELERNIDALHRDAVKHLYSQDLDAKTLHLAVGLIEHLEDLADIGEDVTDAIRIIAVARKGHF